ncbi:hypothetical protein [Nonomuraea sp. NPDC002799]
MSVSEVAAAVALIAGTGAVSGLSEQAALNMVTTIRERIRTIFGDDTPAVRKLERAVEQGDDEDAVRDLAEALCSYAEQDENFAAELAGWAQQRPPAGSVTQTVRAGRDAYTAGRDLTVRRQ